MKQLKLITAATVLTLALSFSAFAGDIHTTLTGDIWTGFVDVPPQTVSATTTSNTSSTAINPLTQIVLALLNLLAA